MSDGDWRSQVVANIKPFVNKVGRQLMVIFLTLFFGAFSGLVLLLQGNRKQGDAKNKVSPSCLQDSSLGVHSSVKIKGTKLHYVERGDKGHKLILCLHDFADFWFGWRHQLKDLGDKFWLVALDLKGYGDSERAWSVAQYSNEVILEELKTLIDILQGSEKKVILLGHGFGGGLCWKLALKYPDIVERLILISSPHPNVWLKNVVSSWKRICENHSLFVFKVPYLPEHKLALNHEMFFEKRFKSCSELDEDELRTLKEAYIYTFSEHSDWTGPVNYFRNLNLSQDFNETEDEHKLEIEALLIIGNDDNEVGLDLITASSEVPEKCAVHIVNGAGHFPHQKQSSYVNKIIYKFIEEFDETKSLIEEEDKELETDNLSLYQKSLNRLKQFSFSTETLYGSCETLDVQTPEMSDPLSDLDNVRTIAELNNNGSIYQRSFGRLRNYGASVLKGYKDPIESALMSKSNLLHSNVTLLAKNIFNLYVNEQYM